MNASALAGLVLASLLMPGVIFADCGAVQDTPAVPDGSTASREQMVAANQAVAAFNAAVDQYVNCLRKAGGNLPLENQAIDRLEAVAKSFNAELRAFRKREGG